MRAALLILDLQRGFFRDPELAEAAERAIPVVNEVAEAVAAAGGAVIVLRTVHKQDGSTFSRRMRQKGTVMMLEGTSEVDDLPALDIPPGSIEIDKTRYSAFARTQLERTLHALRVDTVFVCGAFVDGCVGLTAMDASERDFRAIIITDASISSHAGHARGLQRFCGSEFDVGTVASREAISLLQHQLAWVPARPGLTNISP